MDRKPKDILCIASLPRSGSTVLTRMLDTFSDILSLPESFFPGVLDFLTDEEMEDADLVAALFVESCSDGSPLDFAEASACIRRGRAETLDALAEAVAAKSGVRFEDVRVVVWKFTRMVGSFRWAAESGGKFLVLRRPYLNVYESQFRVDFGRKNHNPLRFALFDASYHAAFRNYPKELTMFLDYAAIPSRLAEVARWAGSEAEPGTRASASVADLSGSRPWHSDINKPFRNDDDRKVKNLSPYGRNMALAGRALFRLAPWIGTAARRAADARQMSALRQRALHLLGRLSKPEQTR